MQADASKRPTLHAGGSGPFGGHAHVGFNESTDNDEVLEVAGVVPHGSATVIAVFVADVEHDRTILKFDGYGLARWSAGSVDGCGRPGAQPMIAGA